MQILEVVVLPMVSEYVGILGTLPVVAPELAGYNPHCWVRNVPLRSAAMAAFDPYYKWLAIPPEEQPPNHYRLLALPLYESDPDVIANATDQRMAHLKSFQSGKHSAASQKILNEVAKAKLCLLSPEKKAEYDQELRAELAPVDEPEQTPEGVATAVAPHVEVVSVPRQARQKLQPWHIFAGIAALVVLVVVIAGMLLSDGGPDEVVQTKPDNAQPKDPPPRPDPKPKPPDTKPKPEISRPSHNRVSRCWTTPSSTTVTNWRRRLPRRPLPPPERPKTANCPEKSHCGSSTYNNRSRNP